MSDLEAALARAVECDELVLHYQPIVDARTLEVEAFEALVRWERPGFGLVPPAEFIPVAETSDLICDLEVWVFNEAARQRASWSLAGADPNLAVAVNISGRHLNRKRIRDDVTAALQRHGLGTSQLRLEITETVRVVDGLALENLHDLKRLGVSLSLDDFGAGYSSADQLARLPVDTVKIDKSYVDASTPSTRQRLQQMVDACHSMGLAVVGEGVDTSDKLALLRGLGVESAQGFLLGRPALPGDLRPEVRRPPGFTSGRYPT